MIEQNVEIGPENGCTYDCHGYGNDDDDIKLYDVQNMFSSDQGEVHLYEIKLSSNLNKSSKRVIFIPSNVFS